MEFKLLKTKEMPLLGRTRLSYMCTFDGSTPDRMTLTKEVAKLNKSKPEMVIIKHIYQRFGVGNAKIIANVYTDEKSFNTYADKRLVAKVQKKLEESKKAEDEAKAKAAEEKAAAEKKAKEEAEAAKAEESSEAKEESSEEKSE